MKQFLLLRASHDICQVEIEHIQTVARMHGLEPRVHLVDSQESLNSLEQYTFEFDYIYLASHANPDGFGDQQFFVPWFSFAHVICPLNMFTDRAVFLLACCRGGVEKVSYDIFAGCDRIQFVCGPRWKVTAPDLTVGFHTFIYNMENRRLQPNQAAERASHATGFDFLCYDRVEIERKPEFERHRGAIWEKQPVPVVQAV